MAEGCHDPAMRLWITLLAIAAAAPSCGMQENDDQNTIVTAGIASADNVIGPSGGNQIVQPPVPGKEVNLAKKLKPFVLDLGGHQVAKATGCALTVGFGSIGTGIDNGARQRIEQLLEDDRAVVEIEPYVVGREGEAVLCIRLSAEGEADRLFDALEAIAANAFRVQIVSSGGRAFRSSGERQGT